MVELQPYQPSWADEYRRESKRLLGNLHEHVDALEHIGSTAVPGLLAKPIIDLAARLRPSVTGSILDAQLAALGYQRHTAGPKNHGVYVRAVHDRRTHILHVFTAEQWPECNQRLFRDKLLTDASAREQYERLKASIAGMTDGREYTAAKQELIQELLNEERRSRGLGPATAWDK